MKTFIVTGATQGLGLDIARALAQTPQHRVVIAARDTQRGQAAAQSIGNNVESMRLDLSSLAQVEQFAAAWQEPLTGLINNAGVQITNGTRRTPDGYEETFAVNHLAALALTHGLLPRLQGGRVLFIGSGTHNPTNFTAKLFGFRGAQFTSIEAAARGVATAKSARQSGMDRYATSKFLNMVTAAELARRHPVQQTTFFTLDPGLMPGTGLARTAPSVIRAFWSSCLPRIASLLPDTSTTANSGAAAAWMMTAGELEQHNGAVFSYECELSTRVWAKVYDSEIGRRVVDESNVLLKR